MVLRNCLSSYQKLSHSTTFATIVPKLATRLANAPNVLKSNPKMSSSVASVETSTPSLTIATTKPDHHILNHLISI